MTHFVYMNTQKCLVEMLKKLKNWNDFFFSAESTFKESASKQNFYACARAKNKQCRRDIPLTYRLM